MTYQFIAVAYPLPHPDRLRDWVSGLVRERDRAEAELRDEVARLREAKARLSGEVAGLTAQLDGARAQLADQAAHLAALHEQLELHLDYTAQMRDHLLTAGDRVVQLEAAQTELTEALRRTTEELGWMRASKSWQWIERLWALRRRFRHR